MALMERFEHMDNIKKQMDEMNIAIDHQLRTVEGTRNALAAFTDQMTRHGRPDYQTIYDMHEDIQIRLTHDLKHYSSLNSVIDNFIQLQKWLKVDLVLAENYLLQHPLPPDYNGTKKLQEKAALLSTCIAELESSIVEAENIHSNFTVMLRHCYSYLVVIQTKLKVTADRFITGGELLQELGQLERLVRQKVEAERQSVQSSGAASQNFYLDSSHYLKVLPKNRRRILKAYNVHVKKQGR